MAAEKGGLAHPTPDLILGHEVPRSEGGEEWYKRVGEGS